MGATLGLYTLKNGTVSLMNNLWRADLWYSVIWYMVQSFGETHRQQLV